MIARFAGRCVQCGGAIAAGDRIVHVGRRRNAHATCPRPVNAAGAPGMVGVTYRPYDSCAAVAALRPSAANAAGAAREFGGGGHSADWYGVPGGLAEVDRILAGETWADGLARLADVRETVGEIPPVASRRVTRVRGADGDTCDPDRILSGEYDRAWTRCVRRTVRGGTGRIVRLVASVGAPAMWSADDYFWRGAVAWVLADALESAGYRVEITAAVASSGTYQGADEGLDLATWPLKRADEPLDRARLAVWLCLAGTFRVAGFRQILSDPSRVATPGLGCHRLPSAPAFRSLCDPDGAAIFLSDVTDEESARAEIARVLGAATGETGERESAA